MDYAFGIDTEQYSSSNITDQVQKLMNWQTAALYQPLIRFVFVRAGISWGFKDARFNFNWDGVRSMDFYRAQAGITNLLPVGRGAYHVLYPSQDDATQYDNFMRIVDPVVDWAHDRAVIDLELHQDQSRRTITDRTKRFAYKIKAATGRYPILYTRSIWLNTYTYPAELAFMDLWLAQYRTTQSPYTPEYPPPPSMLPSGFNTWLIHQTGDHCPPIGSPVKQVMDYNRWNGDEKAVAKYFGFETEAEGETPPVEPPEEPPIEGDVMYIIEMLGDMYVRKEPNSKAAILGYAWTGEIHYASKEQGGWYKISTGWLSGMTQYTRITEVETPPEEVPDEPVHNLDWLIRIHTTHTDEHP